MTSRPCEFPPYIPPIGGPLVSCSPPEQHASWHAITSTVKLKFLQAYSKPTIIVRCSITTLGCVRGSGWVEACVRRNRSRRTCRYARCPRELRRRARPGAESQSRRTLRATSRPCKGDPLPSVLPCRSGAVRGGS